MLVGVYIALWGMAHFMGTIKEPLMDATKRFLKVFAIMILALKIGQYNDFFIYVFTKVPEDLTGAALQGFNTGGLGTGANDLKSNLDKLYDSIWNIGFMYWNKGSILGLDIMPYLVGLLVYILAIFIIAYATFLILLSKVALAVLLGIGPLFIMSLLFEATRKYFENWLGFLVNYALVMVLAVAISNLLMAVLMKLYDNAYTEAQAKGIGLSDFGPVAITCIVGCLLYPQILGIASTLGGGVSLSSMGVPGFVGKATKTGLIGNKDMPKHGGVAGLAASGAGLAASGLGAVGGLALKGAKMLVQRPNTVSKATG